MSHEEDLEKAYKHAERVRQKQEIEEIKHSNDTARKQLSFSKIAVIFIFANFLAIELYSMVVMVWFRDLASLGTLIAAVIGQCVTLCGYFVKSDHENTSGGITFETAMYELRENTATKTDEDDGAVG